MSIRKALPLACVLLISQGCTFFQRLLPRPLPAGVAPDSLKIPGPLARASAVATVDFLAAMKKDADAATDPANAKLLECLAQLDAYDVYAGMAADHYTIRIIPVPSRCIAGDPQTYGGAATYEIKQDFTILKKDLDE